MAFSGFSKESTLFLENLELNNDKQWFSQNRFIYDEYLFPQAQNFVVSMGERLRAIAPDIMAIPKTDKSIFRLHRDVRFSKDKSPYKPHLGIFLWEGKRKKIENSGFYFQLNAHKLFMGVGCHQFPKDFMETYRQAVTDSQSGGALREIIENISKNGRYKLGWKSYKRVPAGYDKEHPNADLLLHGGVGFEYESALPKSINEPAFLDDIYTVFSDMAPIHNWLKKYL